MTTPVSITAVRDEQHRLRAEYRRREDAIPSNRYAPWQPAVLAERAARLRAACRLLTEANTFPRPDDECLEIGYGAGGWLADVIGWGVREHRLHGVELDAVRAARAQALLPAADLRVGDATRLPWADGTFRLVIVSTVISSILNDEVRRRVCLEAIRVVAPGGALLWYDLRRNNPQNPAVRGIPARGVRELFPHRPIAVVSTTLAPPLARVVTRHAPLAALALESVPLLRTHLVAVVQP